MAFVRRTLSFSILLIGLALPVRSEVYTIDNPVEWQDWSMPTGVVSITDSGGLELVKYRKEINAVRNADLFTHSTQSRGEVKGGIWRVDSGAATGTNAIDGDVETFWVPDYDDPVQRWQLEIDLGRPVLVKEIRLHFPDMEGARPFQQFRVQVSTGARIQVSNDVFTFDQVYITSKPNYETDIRIQVAGNLDTTRVVDPDLDVDLAVEGRHKLVQYVRIAANEKNEDAAMAEVEVIGVGDNVSLGVLERGGSFENGLLGRDPQNMFDGVMDTFGNVFTTGGHRGYSWEEVGLWWQVDLGATFWLDGIYMYWQDRGEALSSFLYDGFHAGDGYAVLSSEGRRTTSGDIDFDPLVEEPRGTNSREYSLRHFRYLFKPRKARYLLWHGFDLVSRGWYSHPMEFMLFSPGYPAQVNLRSGFIDLGKIVGDGRPKAIKRLMWDAELPPNTRLQLRSRSGNNLEEIYSFYDKKGEEISQEKWNSLPKVIQGPVDTTVIVGGDWGEWSNFYQFSGESFQSDTPRRFIQLELLISTEDPEVAPRVNSVSVDFEAAHVQQAMGQITPRQTVPNEETRFRYTVRTVGDELDAGYDAIRLKVHSLVESEGIDLWIGEEQVTPEEVEVEGDSLLYVYMPEKVISDSVEVLFTARVLRNATVFEVDLGNRDRPELWQSVEALARRANIVYLPALAESQQIIGDLDIASAVFTPNGDGINDLLEIRFAIYKVTEGQPRVFVYDLAGRMVAELEAGKDGQIELFTWTGRSAEGELVEPGIYLCRIDVGSQAGEGELMRTVAVSY